MAIDIVDCFENNSSDSNYNQTFLKFKHESINQEINFDLNEILPINFPITITEVRYTLWQCKNTSPGSDQIPNVFLKKKLSNKTQDYLHKIFNYIWKNKVFPETRVT